jgi:CHAT domain-containing protein/tetratricopeptide (TPR) repeat protein
VTKSGLSDILREASELHRTGLDAACSSRQREGARIMRRGMNLLDSVHPVAAGHHDQWLRLRIRLASSLAFVESELRGAAEGLARLDDVRLLIQSIPDSDVRGELIEPVDHNYGLLLMGAGRNEDSIAYFDASIEYQEHCLADATDPKPLVESFLNTLSTRGLAYTRLGDVRSAREDLTRAVELAERHELPTPAADIRRPLGTLELRVGDVPAALHSYQESERIYRGLGADVPALLRLNQAQALLTAGLADEASSHLDEVLPTMREQQSGSRDLADVEMYRAAAALMNDELDLARELAAVARRRMRRFGCATCVANAALIGLRADVRDALRSGVIPATLPARALRIARTMAEPRLADQATVARMLAARLEIRRGKLARAAELVGQIPRPGQLTPIDQRMLRRLCRAELMAAQGHRGKALTEINVALAELDKVRDRMGGLELVSGTAAHGQELGDLAIRLVLAGANPKRLFDWLERTRAQTYRYEPVAGGDDPELAERVAEVRSLTQSIHQAQHDGHPTAALISRRNERLREAHRLGWHTGRWGKPRPVAGLAEVGKQLKDRALVSFAASEDALVAVVLVDGEVCMVRLGSATRAAEQARMLNADLNALAPDHLPPALVQVVSASARKQADLIDQQIVQPLGQLIGDRDLVIVPTGALYAVPWGVLPSLLSRPTVVAPSATAWLAAEQAGSRRGGRTVLVRAPGLPAAVGEIDKLGAHHSTAKLISGERATVAAVLKALDGAKLAHIAAHGAHEPENALFSKLELADGALFAHEMAGLSKPPRQVVLAACELALNRIRPGDEALGFASALLAIGSQTVIAPLSRVGDQAAAAAMDDYHRGLAAGAKPAVALADAIAIDPLRRPFVCLGSSS